jgi:hypothetical protein
VADATRHEHFAVTPQGHDGRDPDVKEIELERLGR